jgi:hypothetical protein
MANVDNSCSDLKISDLYSQSTDTFGDMLSLQAKTQRDLYGYDFSSMTLKDLMDFWYLNSHSMVDEIHEATDALGGIKDGNGSAIWKKWKGAHSQYSNKQFKDLSERDQLECKFEIIDMFHFFMNYAISIGMTSQEIYNMYMSKNAENHRRQESGY